MIDYNKNYKLYIDNFNDNISYEEYCNKIMGIIRLRWNTQFKIKYESNKYNNCDDFDTFCNMIDDEELVYCNKKLYSNLCDAIEKERNRIKQNKIMELQKIENKAKVEEYKNNIIEALEKRNIRLKTLKSDKMIKYIEELFIDNKTIDDKVLDSIMRYDDIYYHNTQEYKNKKVGEHLWCITRILTELKETNINKITNETIKEMRIIKLINIYNKIYKDQIKISYEYRVKILKDDDNISGYDYLNRIDIKATTFNGDNEPLKTIMKRFYIMLTKPNDKVLELLEKYI
jgi:hypothetical protein